MSWNYVAMSRDKEKLKNDCRASLIPAFSKPGSPHHTLMSKVMNDIDALIDNFNPPPGRLIKVDTHGHLDGGCGNIVVNISTDCGTLLE